ncbi:MAG: hypothetical protein JSV88_00910 [Candidatus Aminicenantes bacterium]|nr:MAG: hypothetical protein JSV88_00910 [Candidatus Aminicenantes bacterium]
MREVKNGRKFLFLSLLFSAVALLLATSPGYSLISEAREWEDNIPLPFLRSTEDQLLDSTFRIDISTIAVTFDYFPWEYYVDCRAVVEFTMRPGQTRAVIHLAPAIRNTNVVSSASLNGEVLNFSDEADVRIISFEGTTQQAFEFQRHLEADTVHTLDISYRLTLPPGYPRFSSKVHDLQGRGNEEWFPTINTPHELARHFLTFRVHSDTAFRCIGSGLVEETVSDVRQWSLDTEREIASYTVMFALMPEEDTIFEERMIGEVPVRIMAFVGGASIDTAFARLQQWLPELETNLGPFPMPRGLSIFLVSSGGGMEYYGGTITALGPLEHEVFHLYFGCSTVNKTYRDSWMDEAISVWYENSLDPAYPPIPDNYTSNIVSGRSAIAVGFDRRAYNEGARIIEAVARELGGRNEMIAFLSYLHRNYSFTPFTTFDFLDFLEEYSNVDMTGRFLNWLYMGSENGYAPNPSSPHWIDKKKPDMTPPRELLKKYGINKRRTK